MRRNRIAFLAAALSCSAVFLLADTQPALAADLTGKTLEPAIGVKFGVQSALGSLLGGTIAGEVTRVVVKRDEPKRIVLAVSYSGFQGGRLWGEITGSDRKPQKLLKGSPAATVEDAQGEIDLHFELDPNAPDNTLVKSAYLRVCVAKPDKSAPSYVKAFELPKHWQTGTRPENVVLTITPKPIGTAATLGASPSAPLPPRLILIDAARPAAVTSPARSLSIQQRAPISAPAASAQPAPASSPQPTTPPAGTRQILMGKTTAMRMTPNVTVAARTDSAVRLLPHTASMAAINRFRFGVPAEDQDKGAKGPADTPVEPLAELRSEDIDLDASHVLGVFPAFYPDQQASAGIYYFLPYSYSLRWTEDSGYDLRMIYSAASSAGQAGEVAMAARLDAGLGLRERQIASDLVAAYAKAHGLPFTALRALPIDSISVSIADDLRRYSIPSSKIAVTGLSDFLGQIDVSWLTDPVTKENLQQALIEDVGISGRVTLHPSGGKLAPVDVPIQIRLADFVTFGPFRWNRTEPWRNRTPYPIRLKYLNALVLDSSSRPIVYSWDLSGTVVPPAGRAQWVAGAVPAWIDAQAKRIWLEYAVESSCGTCDDAVIRSITGGVSSSGPSQITFHTITPLADAGAYEIAAQVRSRYFDPQSREIQTKIVVMNADGKDFTLGPIYLGSRQPGDAIPGDPIFEYQLELIMKDGTTHKATRWLSSDDLRIAIGRRQLEDAIGANLPTAR